MWISHLLVQAEFKMTNHHPYQMRGPYKKLKGVEHWFLDKPLPISQKIS